MTVACYPASTFKVSTDFSLLDRKWVVSQILTQYWGKFRDEKKILRSMMHSINFGLYEIAADRPEVIMPKQIGFAQVLSNHSTISYLSDVIIDEKYRGKGLGKYLLSQIVLHPAVNNTVCLLRTRDGHRLYSGFGFSPAEGMLRKPGGAA